MEMFFQNDNKGRRYSTNTSTSSSSGYSHNNYTTGRDQSDSEYEMEMRSWVLHIYWRLGKLFLFRTIHASYESGLNKASDSQDEDEYIDARQVVIY